MAARFGESRLMLLLTTLFIKQCCECQHGKRSWFLPLLLRRSPFLSSRVERRRGRAKPRDLVFIAVGGGDFGLNNVVTVNTLRYTGLENAKNEALSPRQSAGSLAQCGATPHLRSGTDRLYP